MPKLPENRDFIDSVVDELSARLLYETGDSWTVLLSDKMKHTYMNMPKNRKNTVVVSIFAIRRLMCRKFYRKLHVRPILLTRRGLVAEITNRIVMDVTNKEYNSLPKDRLYTFECPDCSHRFRKSADKWIHKQCESCNHWWAKGRYILCH